MLPWRNSLALVDSRWTPTPTETPRQNAGPTLRAIGEIVCANRGVSRLDVMSSDARARVEAARRIIAWLAYAHGYDTPDIGVYLDREPLAVRAMIAVLDRLIDANPKTADRMIGISRLLTLPAGDR